MAEGHMGAAAGHLTQAQGMKGPREAGARPVVGQLVVVMVVPVHDQLGQVQVYRCCASLTLPVLVPCPSAARSPRVESESAA